MGEIAEMMLDGTLCESCGAFVGEPVGHPLRCEDCTSEAKPRRKEQPSRKHAKGDKEHG